MSNVQTTKTTPQIRFKGFNEEWIEKELGKTCTFSKGHGYSKKDLTQEGTPVYLYGQMYTNYKTAITQSDTYVKPQADSVYSSGKEVILPGSGETPEDIARATAVLSKGIILGGDINIVYPPKDLSQIFLALSISYEENRNKLAEQAQGATISHLHNTDIAKLSIAYPSLNEQTKIEDLFSQIDSLIASTQKEHDKLAALKKCMLQKMFPKKGCLVPEIRFKGFSGNWEEKKLNEYLEPSKAKNFDNKYSKQDVLSVSGEFGIVNQIEFQGRSFAGEFVDNYGIVETNDIVYTKSPLSANPYGIIKNNFGRPGIVSTLYAVYKAKENTDSAFVQRYFDLNNRLNDYLRPLVRKGAKNDMKVSSADALLGNVVFPKSFEEQKKIGYYFQNLDNLISKQSAELEKLKNLKKTLLSKMFV